MIALTYAISGRLIAGSGYLFLIGAVSALTQCLAWMVTFLRFGRRDCCLPYRRCSRSRSEFSRIAFFFAIGTGIGGVVSPWLFANLINEGRESLYLGFIVLSATMSAAALIELIWGVAAERRPLEDVARPLTFIKMTPWDVLRYRVNSLSRHEVSARSKQDDHLQCNPSHTLYRTARL